MYALVRVEDKSSGRAGGSSICLRESAPAGFDPVGIYTATKGNDSRLDLSTKKKVDSKGPDLVSLIMLASNILWMVRSRHGFVRVYLFILEVQGFIKTLTPSFHFFKNVS